MQIPSILSLAVLFASVQAYSFGPSGILSRPELYDQLAARDAYIAELESRNDHQQFLLARTSYKHGDTKKAAQVSGVIGAAPALVAAKIGGSVPVIGSALALSGLAAAGVGGALGAAAGAAIDGLREAGSAMKNRFTGRNCASSAASSEVQFAGRSFEDNFDRFLDY